MSEYSIHFAQVKDTEAIMDYIDRCWRKGHILSRNRELFLWQYGRYDDRLNIVVGMDDSGIIQGILGFISYGDFDNKDLALALWKASNGTGFLGIKLLDYLMDNEPHREIVCPGINLVTTKRIYERFGMKVGTMRHWYRLAPRDSYFISKINDFTIPDCSDAVVDLVKISTDEELRETVSLIDSEFINIVPFKSTSYLKKRYLNHPIYKYMVFGLKDNENSTRSILVFRIQEHNRSRALRLIDCIGNNYEKNLAQVADKLMSELDCEYTDFYEAGLNEDKLNSNGWRKVKDDKNIIPDYFAPYECKNVDIHYSTSNIEAVLFKGDGDQDRPS